MKSGDRCRGALCGGVVSVLLMSLCHTMPEYILIMAVMTCFMYYAPVTSWTMMVYSTCYGMTLAQMRLGLMESVTLRLSYVALAAVPRRWPTGSCCPTPPDGSFPKAWRSCSSWT